MRLADDGCLDTALYRQMLEWKRSLIHTTISPSQKYQQCVTVECKAHGRLNSLQKCHWK